MNNIHVRERAHSNTLCVRGTRDHMRTTHVYARIENGKIVQDILQWFITFKYQRRLAPAFCCRLRRTSTNTKNGEYTVNYMQKLNQVVAVSLPLTVVGAVSGSSVQRGKYAYQSDSKKKKYWVVHVSSCWKRRRRNWTIDIHIHTLHATSS